MLDPSQPTNYYKVPIVRTEREPLSATDYHDRLSHRTGLMTLSIYTLTPVFIGTGDYELDAQGIFLPPLEPHYYTRNVGQGCGQVVC